MDFVRLNVLLEQAVVAKYLENKVLRGCETPAALPMMQEVQRADSGLNYADRPSSSTPRMTILPV